MKDIKSERLHYIDAVRVISICLVIALHCIVGYYNDITNRGCLLWGGLSFINELCRVGVPLFFMISGALLLRENITSVRDFYRHRFLKIAIPFLAYDVFYYVVRCMQYGETFSVLRFLQELANSGSAYHLWFVYSILALYLFLPFLKKIIDASTTRVLWLFLLLLTFQTTMKPFLNILLEGKVYFFLTEDGFVGYLGYMLLGYLLAHSRISVRTEAVIYTLGGLFFLFVPLFSALWAAPEKAYIFNGGYMLNHYAEAAAVFLLLKQFIKCGGKLLACASACTLDAYFIHVFVIDQLLRFPFVRQLSNGVGMLVIIPAAVLISFFWAWGRTSLTKVLKAKRRLGEEGADRHVD